MPNTPSSRRTSPRRSLREGPLTRTPIVLVTVAASVSALALVVLSSEGWWHQRKTVELGGPPTSEKSPGPAAPPLVENTTEPTPPRGPVLAEPAREPARAFPVAEDPVAAPPALEPSELYLSVTERREAEEERRQRAASESPSDESASPRLLETPEEEAAMDELAEQRELVRNQWADAKEPS